MKKTNIKIILSIALIIFTILILTNNVFAIEIDPEDYDPDARLDDGSFLEKAGRLIGVLQFLGSTFAVAGIAIIGIKYLFSSVEGKAEYKKTMFPYIIGCFMIGGICLVLEVIEQVAV